MKINRPGLYLLSGLLPVLLLSTSAGAAPTSGPLYGTPVTMDQSTINLSESLNTDATGWVVSFDQYDQTGQLAQYTVTTDTGDSCTVMTADVGAQENCVLNLVNGDSGVTPTISEVTYAPVVAMASGTLNNGGPLGMGDVTPTTLSADQAPVVLDTANATVGDNGDGTFTLTIPFSTGQPGVGSYTFTTTAGDTCTDVAPTTTAECTISPSDGQQPIIDTVTWNPIVAVDFKMYSTARGGANPVVSSSMNSAGQESGTSALWSAGIMGLVTTLGVFWLNNRARRRRTF